MKLNVKKKWIKGFAITMVVSMFFEVGAPVTAWALTSGPTQPEVQSFEPIGTTEMVDLFSGDFTYNIPLLELPGPNGGYPFNLSYHSGITMDQEASWVGLGWNLNAGVINRNVRGLPDDFKGDMVTETRDAKPNITYGLNFGNNIEVFGADGQKGVISPTGSWGVKFYHNNYRGFGYGVDFGVGFGTNNNEGISAKLGLNLSMDSQEGIDFSPSLSLSHAEEMRNGNELFTGSGSMSVSTSFGTRRGMSDLNLGYSGSINKEGSFDDDGNYTEDESKSVGSGSSAGISFSKSTHVPFMTQEMTGLELSGRIKLGAGAQGIFGNAVVGGFFKESKLKNRGKAVPTGAYGYCYSEYGDDESLLDFNREKDGPLYPNSPNLGSSFGTYDAFSISGQGIGGMFRSYRNDIGITHDNASKSSFAGGDLSLDVGAPGKVGIGLSFTGTSTKAGPWDDQNQIRNNVGFGTFDSTDTDFERFYMRLFGEINQNETNNLNYIGGEDPIRVDLSNSVADFVTNSKATTDFINDKGTKYTAAPMDGSVRKQRNQVVQQFTNDDLDQYGEVRSEFAVKYFTNANKVFDNSFNSMTKLDRDARKGHHFAGFTVTQSNGQRYNYGLPAYNEIQNEYSFSVASTGSNCGPFIDVPGSGSSISYKAANTNEQYLKKETPEYAHSYLLTSILGTDYVDADDVVGPSEGDFGYWVKFNYVKPDASDFKWRSPFVGANLMKGMISEFADDQGTFMYGEKEIWYLASAETRTHFVEFNISKSKRYDGYGAASEIQNESDPSITGNSGYRLDSISLFSKAARFPNGGSDTLATPIQQIMFNYSHDLCPNVPNNVNFDETKTTWATAPDNSGKLTLKSVSFVYQNNRRGMLNPYQFDYNEDVASENPMYDQENVDWWGNYRVATGNSCYNQQFPYTDQFETRDQLDKNAAAWHLKEIILPSGGKLKVDYEADDYAYVQDEIAMQMLPITGFKSINDTEIYDKGDDYAGTGDEVNRRVYFRLVDSLTSTAQLDDYLTGIDQVYIKAKVDLKKTGDIYTEYVGGYYEIETDTNLRNLAGQGPNGKYGQAYVTLKTSKKKPNKYHPVAIACWQYLRSNLPQYANNVSSVGNATMNNVDAGSSQAKKLAAIKSLISFANDLSTIFRGFYGHAKGEEWSSKFYANEAWIRLNSQKRKKVGGGVRVKQVTMNDSWFEATKDRETSSEYGSVYDYRMIASQPSVAGAQPGRAQLKTSNPNQIVYLEESSGVASYEPQVGGEEIPLRKARFYEENIPVMSNNQMFFQLPINEALMPGASVGYRCVTVKSLASDQVIENTLNADARTTGIAIHEFHTAKDFPVIVDETAMTTDAKRKWSLTIPLFLLGMKSWDYMTASQGYSIELNDMHGKLHQVTNYGVDSLGGVIAPFVSRVRYNYKTKSKLGQGKYVQIPDNEVEVLTFDVDPNDYTQSLIETKKLGEEHDFYLDMRESTSKTTNVGVDMNLDVLYVPFPVPIPLPWPNINLSKQKVRTAVTNKVIHRTGILESIEAWNEGSRVETKNIYWDPATGQPLLTTVTNEYNDPVYKYEYPARWAYEGMGQGYRNVGLRFSADGSDFVSVNGDIAELYEIAGTVTGFTDVKSKLVPGDEFIVSGGTNFEKAVFVAEKSGKYYFSFEIGGLHASGTSLIEFFLVRSGRRNMLDAKVEQITALKDPTHDREVGACWRDAWKLSSIIDSTYEVEYPAPCMENLLKLMTIIYPVSSADTILLNQSPYSSYLNNCQSCNYAVSMVGPEYFLNFHNDLQPAGSWCCQLILHDSVGNEISMTTLDSLDSVYYCPAPISLGSTGVFQQMCAKYWVSGNPYPKTAYFYTEGCNLPMKTRIDAILKDTVYRFAVPDTLFKIDSVLNATATSYSDAWINDYQDARFTSNHVSIINNLHKMEGFWTGERGVWKPMESYVYVDDRDQTPSVDLREDGAFNEVPMFNFQSLVMLGCAEKWKKVNEITRVNPYGYETENRDILGVYSTALYGFGGRLPVAVAANSAYHEVAFESFEEYDNNETIDQFEMTTGNLDLYNYKQPASTSPFRVFEFYDVFFGSKDTASTTEGNSQFWTYTKDSVKFAARCHGHSNRIATHAADMAKRFASYRDLASRSNNGGFEEYKISDAPVFHLKPDTVVWKGRMGVPQDVNLINSGYNIFFSSARAHTGTKSMKVVGKTTFPQNRFRPTENEEYLFSAWVSQDSSLVPTFKGSSLANANRLGIEVHFIDSAGNTISSTGLIEPSGHPVEGWQKIEGSFTIPDSTVRVELTLQPNVVGGSAVNAYFDDIRFMPADAAMKTYVYDPDNYRLKAILDDNNYATIYRYDDQGNLFLVMKETARGIKTIQESRSHLRELLAP